MSSSRVASVVSYSELVALFAEWRAFERPPLLDGAPDYTAERFVACAPAFAKLRARLGATDPRGWPVPQQVDWHIVRAEMNGYDFNLRVLKPWARDPAFYRSIWSQRSDVPAHEGPTHHAVVELWTYAFPLSPTEELRLTRELGVIAPLMAQAERNLAGNARELWITGTQIIREQRDDLDALRRRLGEGTTAALMSVIATARSATDRLVTWLEARTAVKTGPSGIGRDAYTWYQRNVHLVPLTWEEEVRLLERELHRAWSSLELEEHRNRGLAPLVAAATPAEYAARAEAALERLVRFLDEQQILTVEDYMEPALREQRREFVPEAERNFFTTISHHDPTVLYTHYYHWIELARRDRTPHSSPIRRGPQLYNIFDGRCEGLATGVEEMFMHAGLYDASPRSRELVWIMLAQRAARGLGSLHAHANEMTMEEAGRVHCEWTPRGWMKVEMAQLVFEQQLYLRQPGYGTSYITGKYQLERLLADHAKQRETRGQPARFARFFDEISAIDCIPLSLVRWELTGCDDEIRALASDG